MVIQRRTRANFGMRAIRFGGECPASIVAKKRQLRKRAEEVNHREHKGAQGKSAQCKVDSPRVSLFLVSLFLCAPCGEKV